MQMQTCMRDVERLETQVEQMRTSTSNKGDNDMDLAKKLIHFERDLGQ